MVSPIDGRRAAFRVAAFGMTLLSLATFGATSAQQPGQGKSGEVAGRKPIKALLVVGGCCHDYDRQKLIIPKGVSARANVEWTVVHQGGTATNSAIPLYDDPDWAKGYDVVVHNECFSDVKDLEFVRGILKPHREGTPAVLIHCAMHCYRTGTDDWFEFVGLQSPGHGPHYAYTVDNRAADSPIMRGFGENWTVPKGELYHSVKLWPTCKPLATANRQEDGQPQTCIWTNEYGKTRVFGTTIGHYNETMVEPKYLDMLTRGILWACGRDVEKEFKATDAEADAAIKALLAVDPKAGGAAPKPVVSTACCGQGNLALGKTTKASSEESGKNNLAKNAVDGDLATRWCANQPDAGEWWQVDLGEVRPVASIRLHWEGTQAAYQYRIEASTDGNAWTQVVDATKNDKAGRVSAHELPQPIDARYLRVTYYGSSTGAWGSFFEFEAYEGSLPPLAGIVKDTPFLECCTDGNFAFSSQAKASSEETGKGNLAPNAVDGDLQTRWCANSPNPNQSWEVDFGQVRPLKSLRIHWEGNAAYRYTIDAAGPGGAWKKVVDRSANGESARVVEHVLGDTVEASKLRITYLGSSTGGWASFHEVEAYAGDLPKVPEGAEKFSAGGTNAGIADVAAPPEFEVTLFGAPPRVNYPVCLAATATGELFVGVDPQGSLGKQAGEGKILRCKDVDGDGAADEIVEFARVDHPRGLIHDGKQLWCLHPPFLSVYTDGDGDGVADGKKTLLTGVSTEKLVAERGADHTTNGIRMGIDGWIYIAVGDFGMHECVGVDGRKLSVKGGGILRVRPDGTEMEVFAWGLRNVLDACIDPYLNIFTRDNTNDGGGWNVRVSHILQSGLYGYPSLYDRFAEESLPPLADYGGGSGCGGMYLHDARLPGKFGDAALTCDWGRSEVYLHSFPAAGATFAPHQELFVKIPRPTDIDVDGSGLIYVASWKNGNFAYEGEDVGFVAQLRPVNFAPKPTPDFATLSIDDLIGELSGPSAALRLTAQRELLRRGESEEAVKALYLAARNGQTPLYGRVAAIFTLKQLLGARANEGLARLAEDASVREWALRALTDRQSQLDGVAKEPFVAALTDANPRVVAQALTSLGRLGDPSAAEAILPLTVRPADAPPPPTEAPLHAQPDPARVIPHLAVRALVALDGRQVALAGLDGPYRSGAIEALRYLHDPGVVEEVAARVGEAQDDAARRELLGLLARLRHREGEYKGDWWGTRPDHSGPYYDAVAWAATPQVDAALAAAYEQGSPATKAFLARELERLKVKLDGVQIASAEAMTDAGAPIALPAKSTDPNAIGNLSLEDAFLRANSAKGDAAKGKELFATKQCNACHTDAEGQAPKGPHLVDIGKRYKRPELVESVLRPSAKLAQGFESWAFVTSEGRTLNGFVTSESASEIEIRQADGKAIRLAKDDVEARKKVDVSVMPEGLVNDLTPEGLADLLAYLESLKSAEGAK